MKPCSRGEAKHFGACHLLQVPLVAIQRHTDSDVTAIAMLVLIEPLATILIQDCVKCRMNRRQPPMLTTRTRPDQAFGSIGVLDWNAVTIWLALYHTCFVP